MRYLLASSLILLTGCSTLPEAAKPDFKPTTAFEDTDPLHLYSVPSPALVTEYPKVKVIEGSKGNVYACFEEQGFREIVRIRGYNEVNALTILDLQEVIDARTEVANDWLKAAQASEKEANGLKDLRSIEQSDWAREKRELTKVLWRDRIVGGVVIGLLILAL